MKIVWLCNIVLPIISVDLGEKVNSFGGWLTGALNKLMLKENLTITILFPYHEYISGEIKNMKYVSFIPKNKVTHIEEFFHNFLSKEIPDVIHVFGTEYNHTLAMVNAVERLNILDILVIGIQGLVSRYAEHFSDGIPINIVKKYTFRDILRRDNIYLAAIKMQKRGCDEIASIKTVKNLIGRTEWDKAVVSFINPNADYYFCNETLRSSFYNGTWDIKNIDKHSLFVSQGDYTIKGLHIMLKATKLLLQKYPNIEVNVCGGNVFKTNSVMNKIKQSSFSKYIMNLIKEYKLENNVRFLGVLSEEKVFEHMVKTHVFVSPSLMENSSNAIGEAAIMGVPVVASYVGGTPSMYSEEEILFFQSCEYHMLAKKISDFFDSEDLCQKHSESIRKKALMIYDENANQEALLRIYEKLSQKKYAVRNKL